MTRETTIIDYQESITRVLLYIQQHMDEDLTLDTLSGVACFSAFHFHRIFKSMVGESTGEYIRRLRLEQAAMRLTTSGEQVTAIALDAGYDTPAAMTRAFKKLFGITPTEFRDQRKSFTGTASLIHSLKEAVPMEPEIVTLPDQKVLFVRKSGTYQKAAEQAWPVLMKFAYSHRLMNKNTKVIGISLDDPKITDNSKLRYDACITIEKAVQPEGEVAVQTIAGGTYAKFLHKGPYEKFSETYDAAFRWITTSGCKLRNLPCFEQYLNRDPSRTKPENLRTEIYIPISKTDAT